MPFFLLLNNNKSPTDSFADFLGLFGQRFRIGNILIRDGGKEFLFIFTIERRLADQHFVEEDTVGPPVDTLTVRLIQNDLKGKTQEEDEDGNKSKKGK